MNTRAEAGSRRDVVDRAYALIKQLERRLADAERAVPEPIAIVGMDCRFPGSANSPQAFWRLLAERGDATRPFPQERRGGAPVTAPVFGAFLDDVDQFDAGFFGITPREARMLDPQQRLLLETSWRALEHAGQAPDKLVATRTGVFVGMSMLEYGRLMEEAACDLTEVYAATGNALNTAAGRIAFVLGLQGPCLSIDTACSSSLVALHTACRSLRGRECDLALAGGVNLVLLSRWSHVMSGWGLMAADGRCKTFDASADGFVRSEGCGMVALRRLADAEARGDRILAVILGSAVNHDGHSSGLTVPNGLAQQALIRAALDDAGLQPDAIDYVEAHGTGTPVGDPIEVEALAHAIGRGRADGPPLLIGSVKTNIGHAEAASGIAGVMKVVLGLQHQSIPPHLHFSTPNPAIPWTLAPLRVTTDATAWPRSARRRVAGISSFGFSGTNAHVIVGEPLEAAGAPHAGEDRPVHVLTMSARHPDSLRELASAYVERLSSLAAADLPALCYSANTGRARMVERLAVAAPTPQSMASALEAWLGEGSAPSVFRSTCRPTHAPKLALLFTGQGSQFAGMGRVLYETNAVVREVLDDCARRLKPHMERPLLDVMFGAEAGRIDDTAYAQPALFALEYALAALWRAWGVVPDVVVGHSVGEIVAATVAEVMTLDDGLRLVAARGRLMQKLPRDGAMAAVLTDRATVEAAIADVRDTVAIAAVNGPANVVVSGAREAVAGVCGRLGAAGVKHVPLAVSHAFHSPLMEPMLDELEEVARTIEYRTPTAVLLSNLSGGRCGKLDAAYWRRHAREAVQFLSNAYQLEREGVEVAVEVGPSALAGMVERALRPQALTAVASIRRGQDDWRTLCEAAARLDVHGAPIDWEAFDAGRTRRRVDVPASPFRRQRVWFDAAPRRPIREATPTAAAAMAGTLLMVASRPGVSVSEQVISLDRFPFLADHRVRDLIVVPATAYIEMVVTAVSDRCGWRPLAIDEMEFTAAMLLEPAIELVTQVTLEGTDDELRFTVHSRPRAQRSGAWTAHATGRARPLAADDSADWRERADATRDRCTEPLDADLLYARLAESGNQFGPSFRNARALRLGPGEAHAVIEPAAGLGETLADYLFHPAVADALGHVLLGAAKIGTTGIRDLVGRRAREIRLYRPMRGAAFEVVATVSSSPGETDAITGSVIAFDAGGQPVAASLDVTLRQLGSRTPPAISTSSWWYGVEWERTPAQAPAHVPGPVVVVSADVATAALIGESLAGARASVERIDGPAASQPVPMTRERANAVVTQLRASGDEAGHLVYVCADAPEFIDSVEALEARIVADCASVVHLAQALTEAPPSTGRLWVVTRQAVQVAGEPVSIVHAPLWGLGRCLATDCGAAWGGLVDLDRTMSPGAAGRALSGVLAASGPERQFALRDGSYVPRLVRRQATAATRSFEVDPDGAYLVTGGLGGLGLVVADWLVRRGARHLVLVGRRALPPRALWDDATALGEAGGAIAAVRTMEQAGASVRLIAADIGDPAAVESLLQSFGDGGVGLRGIFHTAGVTAHEPLARQNADMFRRMFAGKLRGAWLLERQCPDADLVLFSSGSALFGPPYLGAYASANAFLDALALGGATPGRRGRVVSINWGAWGEVGMAARAEARTGRAGDLATAMTPAQGVAALEQVLACGMSSLAVVPIDWAKWRQHGASDQPFFARLAEAAPSPAPKPNAESCHAAPAETDDQQALLAQFARVMELPVDALDLDEPLVALGLDSLMAVELRGAIERSHGVSIALDQLLGSATARQLLEYITEQQTAPAAALPIGTLVHQEEGQI
jgi:phthiocerol/phenolphthiocerol synthesis type-I polyketide synthase D